MPPVNTPMMQQYLRMKEQHPDCILMFRLGDFYEMFNEDARLVSKELDLTLTSRDRGKPEAERTPMCGVPYHSADAYIARLIAKGYKVAICEQMEDPATAKGLVDRDIIRIVTPGTVMNETMLEEGRNNFICALYRDSGGTGACFCDLSTGECAAGVFSPEEGEHLYNELGRYAPREAVLSDGNIGFNIYGKETRTENRSIEFESETIETTESDEIRYVATDDYIGEMYTSSSAQEGMTAQLWKIVYEDGEEVSRDTVNYSQYNGSAETVSVGTASDNEEDTEKMNAAIETQDEEQILAAIQEITEGSSGE